MGPHARRSPRCDKAHRAEGQTSRAERGQTGTLADHRSQRWRQRFGGRLQEAREDRAKQARQKPTLEARGEPRKVQLRGAAERRRGEQLQRLRIAGLEAGLAGK